jgi:SAM-dependent methyltransferase
MLAKLVLPYFGGSPMVWNTCALFFQVLLLAGYLYVHLSTRRFGARRQPWVHLALLLLPLLALPVALPADPAPEPGTEPALWLLRVLLVAVGVPFLLLATTGPLLQRWFSWSGHRRAEDPYFLYAASNAGSVVGLLGYPFVIEPTVGLAAQTRWWSIAYGGFVLLVGACGVLAALAARRTAVTAEPELAADPPDEPSPPVSVRQRLTWVALAFIPSSLMLGVTAHVSTDIAAIPMFWTVPLAVYLATFVVAFGRSSRRPPVVAAVVAAALAIPALLDLAADWNPEVWLLVALHVAVLAAAGLAAHGRLAASRPPTSQLTGFYLWVSVGGALGGLLNGLVAPVVLDRVLEYPLVLALVPLLLLGISGGDRPARRPLVREPVAWATALLVVGALGASFTQSGVLARDRTFYGSYRVTGSSERHALVHGTTVHGWELFSGANAGEPTSYYSRTGPMGDVMTAYGEGEAFRRVALVGMGVGTLAAYGQPGQRMDFYEIDPAVVRLARDSGFFGFLADSEADIQVVLGDGRLGLERAPDSSYGLIVLDAFSSDAIPAHLLTEEAVAEYRRKLAPGGVLAVHITNRHLDLAPVLAAIADRLDLAAVRRDDPGGGEVTATSDWVVLAPDNATLEPLRVKRGWEELVGQSDVRAWTDDYSSLVEVLDVGWP